MLCHAVCVTIMCTIITGAVQEAAAEEDTVVVGVLPGPHANPDYFTDDAVDVFYSSPYEVHYNSNRCAGTVL